MQKLTILRLGLNKMRNEEIPRWIRSITNIGLKLFFELLLLMIWAVLLLDVLTIFTFLLFLISYIFDGVTGPRLGLTHLMTPPLEYFVGFLVVLPWLILGIYLIFRHIYDCGLSTVSDTDCIKNKVFCSVCERFLTWLFSEVVN